MKKSNSIWPCPVYVAKFADGTDIRMSFSSPRGKPYDFDRGRRLVCQVIGNERRRKELLSGIGRLPTAWYDSPYLALGTPPATDIVVAHVEHDGKLVEDPFFSRSNVVSLPKRQSKAAADLAIAMRLLAKLEDAFGSAFPEELAEAQEFLIDRNAA